MMSIDNRIAKKAQQKAIKASGYRRGALRAIKKSHHYIPSANGGIGINQFSEVFKEFVQIDQLLEENNFTLDASEVQAAMVMMFAFDLPVTSDSGINLAILTKTGRSDTPKAGQAKFLYSGPHSSVVTLCLSGRIEGVPSTRPGEQYRTTQERFSLPVPLVLQAPIKVLMKRRTLGERLFSTALMQQLPQLLRVVCVKASRNSNWRITPLRLKSFFRRAVLNDERIPPEFLAYWHGRLAERQRPAPHYSIISFEEVSNVFQLVWMDLFQDVAKVAEYQGWKDRLFAAFEMDHPNRVIDHYEFMVPVQLHLQKAKDEYTPYPKVSPDQLALSLPGAPLPEPRIGYECRPFLGQYVGTSLMASALLIKRLLVELQQVLTQLCGDRRVDLLRAIDIYAFYTALVIMLGSGVRPNKTLIPKIGVCLNWNLLFADDKGKLRPIFCASEVTTQIRAYQDFLLQLRSMLAQCDPLLAMELNNILHEADGKSSALLYCMDNNGGLVSISRSWLDQQFEQYTGLSDAYICRRFIRSELARRHVPAALLGAFMGHHERGNSLAHPFHLASLAQIGERLSTPLSLVLFNLNVQTIHFKRGRFEVQL